MILKKLKDMNNLIKNLIKEIVKILIVYYMIEKKK